MAHAALPVFLASAALAAAAAPLQDPQQSGGYGYGGGNLGAARVGSGANNAMPGAPTDTPPGVGYNVQGGEMSRQTSQKAALASDYHIHFAGATAADAAGAGGGPPLGQGETQPGYVQAKFVHPYGNAVVSHHYGPGYPPPLGTPGTGPNDGNGAGLNAYSSAVAGDPGLVNWGLTPAYTAEEIGNGAWFGPGGSGTVAGNPGMVNWGLIPGQEREQWGNGIWFSGAGSGTGNPVPYVGSFND